MTAVVSSIADADLQAIAAEAAAAMAAGSQVEPFSQRHPGLDASLAYRVAADIHARRVAAGERPVGRKIGFTNRTIWDEYGVHAPMWGYIYDTTVRDLAEAGDGLPLERFAEPRLEPEIMFGIARAPEPGMGEAELFGCLDWVAHGFEIVQSIYPGWRFSAADTIAAGGLHGALLIGPRVKLDAESGWLERLSGFEIALYRDGTLEDRGHAGNVLDGPVSALRHLVGLLAEDTINPPLAAGEIVSTGTLTRALPVRPGETWHTELHGIDLPGARVRF